MTFEQSEAEIAWWCQSRASALGVSGVGFEGGSASVWDEARSARVHGLRIDEESGELEVTRTGRLSLRHRGNVDREARIAETVTAVPEETLRLLYAAFAPVGASHFVANFFEAGVRAPLVGLGLVMWYELKDDETRAPHALLERWDVDLKSPDEVTGNVARRKQAEAQRLAKRLLAPVRRRTVDVYAEAVAIYDEVRSERVRGVRDARALEIAALRASLAAQ